MYTDGEEYASSDEFDREEANAIESLALTFDPDPLATIRRRQRQREIEEGPQEPDPDEWYDRYRDERDNG